LAIVLMIIAAIVSVVVGWFKPDDIERWMDKALHFGRNATGSFDELDAQLNVLAKLRV